MEIKNNTMDYKIYCENKGGLWKKNMVNNMCMHLVGMVIRLKHAKPQSPAKNEPINKNLPFGWNEKVFSF